MVGGEPLQAADIELSWICDLSLWPGARAVSVILRVLGQVGQKGLMIIFLYDDYILYILYY
jgi:hypothetical protein